MGKYVQYLNIGFGIFKNIQEVKDWDVDLAVEEALSLNDPKQDIQIIGFRFFEKDEKKNNISKTSGIYYFQGEIVKCPCEDGDIVEYYRKKEVQVPSVPMIKIKTPWLMLYPYEEGDQVLDIASSKEIEMFRKRQADITRLRRDIDSYKENLVEELRKVADMIEAEQFTLLPFASGFGENGESLDILGDGGNFRKHIEYLEDKMKQIRLLQTNKKDCDMDE